MLFKNGEDFYWNVCGITTLHLRSDGGDIVHLQLEKMHENHAQFEEEFSRRNRETAQVVSQHQELMECLTEESEAKNQLALELHKAEGKERKLSEVALSFAQSSFLLTSMVCFLFSGFLGL